MSVAVAAVPEQQFQASRQVEEEGELLVVTADGKGVPLIRKQEKATPVHGPKPARPNNRRMSTVASVYSVARHHRTPADVVAALFRDERPDVLLQLEMESLTILLFLNHSEI